MEVVSKEDYPNRDYESLFAFMQYCQRVARERNRPQIASICLETRYLDPLAVLQSIYEPSHLCLYFEYPASDFAIVGAEVVVEGVFSGSERFLRVKEFSQDILENSIVIGDLDIPFTGPHFFTSFTFQDEVSDEDLFPSARVFLPRWQVVRSNSVCCAVANVAIGSESNLTLLAQKVWGAHQKFNVFDYRQVLLDGKDDESRFIELGGVGWYEKAVGKAMACIKGGDFQKIVIARELDIEGSRLFDPLTSLNRLREKFPQCTSCFVSNGLGQSFITTSPERLLKVEKGRIKTEAVAGSAPRGESAIEDVQFGKNLLESDKDLREHRFVVDSIVERLEVLNMVPEYKKMPGLKKLANVQHLCTPIEAEMAESLHFLDIAAVLHPTPAVCGTPLNVTREMISDIENFERGLYAGVMGWFNAYGDGELVVGIRSALIDGQKARLYTGSGIVEGSDPDSERRETDIKLQAILQNLQ